MNKVIVVYLVSTAAAVIGQQSDIPVSLLAAEHRGDNCDCMEYWSCVMSGGSTYSYCGLSESSVCCLIPPGATPSKGLLPAPDQSKPKCGVKGFDSGRDGFAEPSEWPWHVAIIEDETYFYVCGGTLIDEYWILTAAHCVHDVSRTRTKLKVRLGEYDVSSSNENLPHEDRSVKTIVIHPTFNNQTLHNDIALLELTHPAKQRTHIDVVCLATSGLGFDTRSKCFVTGWGRQDEGGEHSEVLKEIPVPLWSSSECESVLKNEFGDGYQLPETAVCAGAQKRDACDGDGGGPLVCQKDGQWFQIGIVSFGIGCGQKNIPGVYTKVERYEKWIKDTVLPTKLKLKT